MSVKSVDGKGPGGSSDSTGAWDSAVKDANEVGIHWERPKDDKRSAEDIIDDTPLLKKLGNQSGVKDKLKERVGDFEKDADAAYRAAQVLEHIERFDSNGNRLAGKDVGNGEVNGFTSQGHARNGTEAGRLQDFGKYGFTHLKGELNDPKKVGDDKDAREQAEALGIQWERPDGDDRSAKEIIEGDRLLKNLGNQSGVKDALKEQVGDFEKDADAAYRATQVLKHIEQFDRNGERIVGGDVGNGEINGFTSKREARDNTEAGRLQNFGKEGFSALKGELKDLSKVEDDKKAREQAEKLGIRWERPEGDERSAEDIVDGDPLLRQLGNHSGVRDSLKERVGDFDRDADAAYRASQVLKHIEQFDGDGKRIVGGDVGNGEINGFTSKREAHDKTEAGRLQNFGKDGFSALKGELKDATSVGDDKKAREDAEKVGIKWERPEGDDRSAKEIITDTPVLKELGNHSGVKDMLKERVGDYETDADAAYRAMQVLDRVVLYDREGKPLGGDTPFNDSIDGFTKDREARPDTEAGRLQDFGKEGFSVFKAPVKAEDSQLYKDFTSANKNADEAGKTVARYTAILHENFDAIKGKTGEDYLTADGLKKFKEENTHVSDELKEALDFWSQPGAFEMLDNGKNVLAQNPDGDVGKADLTGWLTNGAPKSATETIDFLKSVATGNTLADVDTSSLGKDVFENPDNYSAEEKAAVLQELITAQQLVISGGEAGMWKDDKSKVTIANRTQTHPDPKLLLEDLNKHIEILQSDAEVVEHLNTKGDEALAKIIEDNEGLKKALQKTYDDEIKSGSALDDLWSTRSAEKVPQSSILAEFTTSLDGYQTALGIEKPSDLQDAVKNSKHEGELKDYYETSVVSGERLEALTKEHGFEAASAIHSMEVALYNSALDPEFTAKHDDKLSETYSKAAQENLLGGASFDDLKVAFGKDGTDELDEAKVEKLIENIREENPQFLLNQDGTVAKDQAIVGAVRNIWDTLRNGTKALDKLDVFDKNGAVWGTVFKGTYDRGVQHGVSGLLLAGLTIGRGATSGGQLTEQQTVAIATGSVQSATVLMEGGSKGFQSYLKDLKGKVDEDIMGNIGSLFDDVPDDLAAQQDALRDKNSFYGRMNDIAKKFENGAKIGGGAAGVALGAYSIFDGVKLLRNGDQLGGGLNIAAGSLGIAAGTASIVEGSAALLGAGEVVLSRLGVAAGALGATAAVVGAVAILVPMIVEEVKQEKRVGSFAGVLGDYVTKYEIDGVEDGTFRDIPDNEWPGYSEGPTIGS